MQQSTTGRPFLARPFYNYTVPRGAPHTTTSAVILVGSLGDGDGGCLLFCTRALYFGFRYTFDGHITGDGQEADLGGLLVRDERLLTEPGLGNVSGKGKRTGFASVSGLRVCCEWCSLHWSVITGA